MTTLPSFNQARVLVVGDVMLDRYWYGATKRISPEAPVPVVKVEERVDKPGGAANVAMNIASLGAHTLLLGCVGNDEAADELETMLHAAHVNTELLRHADSPTITKLRVLSHHQQLIRLDFEQTQGQSAHQELIKPFQKLLAQFNVVVLSDYGKGTLRDPQPLIQAAVAANIPVLVDPKRLDFQAYRGATLVTPNRGEFEAVVGPCADEQTLIAKGTKLLKECDIQGLLITRGEQGMTLITQNHEPLHLPAYAREVYDVTGAGDTVIGVLAASLGAINDLPLAMKLANAAAGVVVGKLGTATVSITELSSALASLQPVKQGIVSIEELLALRGSARHQGETVVMTNGCFDLLHAGHVAYLEQAQALGDRLIVAVNDDNSVKQLKGEGRPLNPLLQRMQVLAGLRAVDWVIPFSADTPRELIAQVLPDILVKGGDYKVEEIAGHKEVLANGGSVKILQFVPGCSTTNIITKIKNEEKS
jgi:D-beta-D-heptose 7-phosphate kinase/D-beta-D-heptose 1-phosphate adenosyltransferase